MNDEDKLWDVSSLTKVANERKEQKKDRAKERTKDAIYIEEWFIRCVFDNFIQFHSRSYQVGMHKAVKGRQSVWQLFKQLKK